MPAPAPTHPVSLTTALSPQNTAQPEMDAGHLGQMTEEPITYEPLPDTSTFTGIHGLFTSILGLSAVLSFLSFCSGFYFGHKVACRKHGLSGRSWKKVSQNSKLNLTVEHSLPGAPVSSCGDCARTTSHTPVELLPPACQLEALIAKLNLVDSSCNDHGIPMENVSQNLDPISLPSPSVSSCGDCETHMFHTPTGSPPQTCQFETPVRDSTFANSSLSHCAASKDNLSPKQIDYPSPSFSTSSRTPISLAPVNPPPLTRRFGATVANSALIDCSLSYSPISMTNTVLKQIDYPPPGLSTPCAIPTTPTSRILGGSPTIPRQLGTPIAESTPVGPFHCAASMENLCVKEIVEYLLPSVKISHKNPLMPTTPHPADLPARTRPSDAPLVDPPSQTLQTATTIIESPFGGPPYNHSSIQDPYRDYSPTTLFRYVCERILTNDVLQNSGYIREPLQVGNP